MAERDRERGERRGKGEGRGFRRRGMGRRKVCRFCADRSLLIDYKDSRVLGTFLSERGKISSRAASPWRRARRTCACSSTTSA